MVSELRGRGASTQTSSHSSNNGMRASRSWFTAKETMYTLSPKASKLSLKSLNAKGYEPNEFNHDEDEPLFQEPFQTSNTSFSMATALAKVE
ncbi:hypothetical protein EG327_002261, partial [Venturia inaequalis]